jgi:hypothetical protein
MEATANALIIAKVFNMVMAPTPLVQSHSLRIMFGSGQ